MPQGDRSTASRRSVASHQRAAATIALACIVSVGTAACDNRVEVQPADIVVSCLDADECYRAGHDAETSLSNPDPSVSDDKYARAAAYYEAGCELDHGAACQGAAMIYIVSASGVKPDAAKALALMSKSCELENFEGCGRLGDMYDNGWAVAPDRAQAREFYGRACDGGYRPACMDVKRLGG